MKNDQDGTPQSTEEKQNETLVCGVIMPISEIDECSEKHWEDVYTLLSESAQEAGFKPNLVSNSDFATVIHAKFIQNLAENPMVICDVSCMNPNVMFELGLRLAFDQPTIIVKDNATKFNFDTMPIDHLLYPRDLNMVSMRKSQDELTRMITATHKEAKEDPNYSPFLKHFGQIKVVPALPTTDVSHQELILQNIYALGLAIASVDFKVSGLSQANAISSEGILDHLQSFVSRRDQDGVRIGESGGTHTAKLVALAALANRSRHVPKENPFKVKPDSG